MPEHAVHHQHLVLAEPGTRTGSGHGPAAEGHSPMRLDLVVTDAAGDSPTLDVTVEHSPDGQVWSTLFPFPQARGVFSERLLLGGAHPHVRAAWTIGGAGAAFTFSVAGRGGC